MKKLYLLLACSLFVVSCIDENYDLTNIDTDKIAIGDQDTEFRVPLALIHISSDEIQSNGIGLEEFFNEADIWLPEPLPAGATDIDVEKLQSDQDYLLELIDALLEQMKTDDRKIDDVAGLIFDNEKYHAVFDFPGLSVSQFADRRNEYLEAFHLAFHSNDIVLSEQLSAAIRKQASDYLNEMDHLDPVSYDLGEIEVGSDVIDMIVGDAADDQVVGALHGWVESRIPAELEIRPAFADTSVAFDLKLLLNRRSDFEEVNIMRKDLEQIFDNARVEASFRMLRYTPRTYDPRQEQLTIRMSLLKKGGLNL